MGHRFAGAAGEWDRRGRQQDEDDAKVAAERERLVKDGPAFRELVLEQPAAWAFESDDLLSRHAPGGDAELLNLKARRILGEAFVGALQKVLLHYHAGRAQTPEERAIALYLEAELAPVIAQRTGTEPPELAAQLAASVIAAKPAPSGPKHVSHFLDRAATSEPAS